MGHISTEILDFISVVKIGLDDNIYKQFVDGVMPLRSSSIDRSNAVAKIMVLLQDHQFLLDGLKNALAGRRPFDMLTHAEALCQLLKDNHPDILRKLMPMLEGICCHDITVDEVVGKMLPMFRKKRHLLDEFIQFIPLRLTKAIAVNGEDNKAPIDKVVELDGGAYHLGNDENNSGDGKWDIRRAFDDENHVLNSLGENNFEDDGVTRDDRSHWKREVSYMILPKDHPLPQSNGYNKIGHEVLNNHVLLDKDGNGEVFKLRTRNKYERDLDDCEDDIFFMDLREGWLCSTLSRIQELLEVVKTHTEKSRSWPQAVNHLTPIHKRTIESLYDEYLSEFMDTLCDNTEVALHALNCHLEKKLKEAKAQRKACQGEWKKIHSENFLPSLDHRSSQFKQQDMKTICSEAFLADIEETKIKLREVEAFAPSDGCAILGEFSYLDSDLHKDIHNIIDSLSCHKLHRQEPSDAVNASQDSNKLSNILEIWADVVEPLLGVERLLNGSEKNTSGSERSQDNCSGSPDAGFVGVAFCGVNDEAVVNPADCVLLNVELRTPSENHGTLLFYRRSRGKRMLEKHKRVSVDNFQIKKVTVDSGMISSDEFQPRRKKQKTELQTEVATREEAKFNRTAESEEAQVTVSGSVLNYRGADLNTQRKSVYCGKMLHGRFCCMDGLQLQQLSSFKPHFGKDDRPRIFYGSSDVYVLFKMHQVLYERLRFAKEIFSDQKWRRNHRTGDPRTQAESTDTGDTSTSPYCKFKTMLLRRWERLVSQHEFEMFCLSEAGPRSYELFTLGNLLSRMRGMLKKLASNENNSKLVDLYHSMRHEQSAESIYRDKARAILGAGDLLRFQYSPGEKKLKIKLMEGAPAPAPGALRGRNMRR